MTYFPDLVEFRRLAQGVRWVPVYRQLTGDSLTPVSAYDSIATGGDSFLFESVVGGERVSRFSFLSADPFATFAATRNVVTRVEAGKTTTASSDDPLVDLERELEHHRAATVPGLPRFCGGAVGFAGYDMVRYTEKLPHAPADDRQLPDLWFGFYDRMVVFDHVRKTILVVALARVDEGDLDAAYARACGHVDEWRAKLAEHRSSLPLCDVSLAGEPQLAYRSNFTRSQFEQAVVRCQEYIRAGDIFQVVISQRLDLEVQSSAQDIYRALRVVNPSPFMFLMRTSAVDLVGASPEIMVRVEDGEATIRPLAGTRRRGRTDDEDRALEEELLADEKERAEHVMLVDLARNDVGRVAQYGTVELSDVMRVERYSHVMHITSNVCGRLQPGKSALDALRAGLPAGTVSGAPKVRAMQIIDEIEPNRRGPYGGAVGYLDFSGNMDTCIALRTLVLKDRHAYVQAGAGIVADSVPASEYEETLNKARGLLKAIEIAETQLAPQRAAHA